MNLIMESEHNAERFAQYAEKLACNLDAMKIYVDMDNTQFAGMVSAYVRSIRGQYNYSDTLNYRQVLSRLHSYKNRIGREADAWVDYACADMDEFAALSTAYADVVALIEELEPEAENDEAEPYFER